MTANETIEQNERAKAWYLRMRKYYVIETQPKSKRINDTRLEVSIYAISYSKPFPWIFQKPVKRLSQDLLPFRYKFSDSLNSVPITVEMAENYILEMLLFFAGYYFDTKRDWFALR